MILVGMCLFVNWISSLNIIQNVTPSLQGITMSSSSLCFRSVWCEGSTDVAPLARSMFLSQLRKSLVQLAKLCCALDVQLVLLICSTTVTISTPHEWARWSGPKQQHRTWQRQTVCVKQRCIIQDGTEQYGGQPGGSGRAVEGHTQRERERERERESERERFQYKISALQATVKGSGFCSISGSRRRQMLTFGQCMLLIDEPVLYNGGPPAGDIKCSKCWSWRMNPTALRCTHTCTYLPLHRHRSLTGVSRNTN